ncbi:MAG TPA: hypothetical protein VGG71_04930 [Chitinophagaceae bacterium]|jgi:hypothetical protein
MKKQFKKWLFRLTVTGLFLFGLLVTFMLNPILLYANKTIVGNYAIYHNKQLDKKFEQRLKQSNILIKSSELYDSKLQIDVCLKDGSNYPKLIKAIMGKDFLSSFYNKIIFVADTVNYNDNYIQLDEHKWNLTQMLAHSQVHCLEFNKYGLWRSNPIGKHPTWKWEGYPEYVSRQNSDQINLQNNIQKLLQIESTANNGWMKFADSTETLIAFDEYRLLIQYCIEIKKMTFVELMKDTTEEKTVKQQMINWYNKQQN